MRFRQWVRYLVRRVGECVDDGLYLARTDPVFQALLVIACIVLVLILFGR